MTWAIAILDESGFLIPTQGDDLIKEFEGFSKLLTTLKECGVERCKHSTFWDVVVQPELTLCDLLFSEDLSPLDHTLRMALLNQIDACSNWNEAGGIADEITNSVQYTIALLEERKAAACVVAQSNEGIIVGEFKGKLHRVSGTASLDAFYKDAPELGDFSERDFIEFAETVFKELFFKSNIVAELGRFSRRYSDIRSELTLALYHLNRDLKRILRECNYDSRCIQAAFQTVSGFEISPESPNTHRNRAAMRQRVVEIDDKKVTCEWHLKFSPTKDRIHFHFGDPKIKGGRTIIGIFTDHLPT